MSETNWRGIVQRSSGLNKVGKSKSKYQPRRQHNQSSDSFIFKEQKSLSHNKSLMDIHVSAGSRSQVELKNEKNFENDSGTGSILNVNTADFASPSKRGQLIDDIPSKIKNRQHADGKNAKFELLTKKNEAQIMKLKRQFLDFQRNVMQQLKRQQQFINQMCDNILIKMQKMISQNFVKNSTAAKQMQLTTSNQLLTFKNIQPIDYKLQKKEFSYQEKAPKINTKSNTQDPIKTTPSSVNRTRNIATNIQSLNIDRFRQAIQSMKDGMKQISKLSQISETDDTTKF